MLGFLVVTALFVVQARNLFVSVMLMGIFSLLVAGLFVVLDAVDVAFTEAAVGAGFSTVLFLGTLALVPAKERAAKPRSARVILPFVVVGATFALLVFATLDMPRYGDPEAPIHSHVAPRYLEESGTEIGIPNVVTSVLASYRGYDTLGEVTVVLTAALGVMLLIGRGRRFPRRRRRRETDTE
ncbi:MAG: DUF4040 domain-containing protein [Alphaproteobacteria bacterium]